MKKIFFLLILNFSVFQIFAQSVPAPEENIPYLITFGPKAATSWGDDDFSQTFFFIIPKKFNKPIYIRVYDPDTGGSLDELNGSFDTQMMYSVYGGRGCYTNKDAQGTEPKGNYKSGNLLASKVFGANPQYDKKWYTFGPFNPTEGEYYEKYGGYIFKVICDGLSGDDGNMYRYFLSTSPKENKPVEGANAFSFEYTFRMWDDPKQVSHIYPYVDERAVTMEISNFDWDDDGYIRIVSVARKGQMCHTSGQDNWASTKIKVLAEEKNTSLDLQLIKRFNPVVKNNNVVVNIKNQFGEYMPFYVSPIGGIPKYRYNIRVRPK
ncbi:MAG: hypothetical protein Q8910_10365 [Bacteroidota bacterium]|nr:hypothetical protein [Bacteroidota bacterium]MDP4226773.1 hypothetical protein [Bacteroidota bacterium]